MTDSETPTWDQLLELITRLDEGGLTEATVRLGDLTVQLSKGAPLSARQATPSNVSADSGTTTSTPSEADVAAQERPVAAPRDPDDAPAGTPVPSPILGVFYRASSPGGDPFVTEGDQVDADRTIGIIEVMKMMNPVTAGVSGRILSFAVADGEAVQFGQPLAYVDETQ
ncbi:MAG TPA: biotin/lipoyl-containing protein [Microbacterium sp.]|uniref:acetyl-CoA carboxylase biotin carboxyl carrier protein n=1 Tax=Microbacterium sp. TaxID=51671 RepID=UPI002D0DEE28|nr:biotin/lipoyl-containing protein [Microbacterium sp.]HWI32492.1 biotin/lipoyl-containing protein [Microbacterium sp.]